MAGVISGKVIAPTKLKGFEVSAWLATRWGLQHYATRKVTASGAFRLKALPFGRYVLVAHPAFDTQSEMAPASSPALSDLADDAYVTLEGPVLDDVEIVVNLGATLSGTVRATDGSPARHASVFLVGEHAELFRIRRPVSTDSSGRWMVTGVAPGRWTIHVRPGEHDPDLPPSYLGGVPDLVDAQFVEVAEIASIQLDLDLPLGGRIDGVLVANERTLAAGNSIPFSRRNKPLPWRAVTADDVKRDPAGEWSWDDFGETEAGGKFSIRGLAEGTYRLDFWMSKEVDLWAPHYRDASSWAAAVPVVVSAGKTVTLEAVMVLEGTEEHEHSVRLEGTARVGETLSAVVTGLHEKASVDYEWCREWNIIHGQSGSSYVIQPEDIGCRIMVRTSAHGRNLITNGNGSEFSRPVVDVNGPEAVPAAAHAAVDLAAVDLRTLPSLGELLTWLQEHAPATFHDLRPGKGDAAIRAAESAIEVEFPEELRALLNAIDGEREDGLMIPMAPLFSLDEIMEQVNIAESVDAEVGHHGRRGATLVPFAGLDGYNFCFRLRALESPDVVFFDKVEGLDDGVRWPSLEAMFAELLESVKTGHDFHYSTPKVDAGQLGWD